MQLAIVDEFFHDHFFGPLTTNEFFGTNDFFSLEGIKGQTALEIQIIEVFYIFDLIQLRWSFIYFTNALIIHFNILVFNQVIVLIIDPNSSVIKMQNSISRLFLIS